MPIIATFSWAVSHRDFSCSSQSPTTAPYGGAVFRGFARCGSRAHPQNSSFAKPSATMRILFSMIHARTGIFEKFSSAIGIAAISGELEPQRDRKLGTVELITFLRSLPPRMR